MVESKTSFHVTPHRRYFTTYKGGNLGVVKMRNYDKSKVVGVEDVMVVVTNLVDNLILKMFIML